MVADFNNKILSGEQQSSNISSNYRVLIAGRVSGDVGREIRVVAQTPEEIGIQIDNEWESLIANGEIPFSGLGAVPGAFGRFLGGTVSGRIGQGLGAAATATGITRFNQGLTAQVWRGSTPLEIQLPLLLNARESAFDDVVVPIRNLIQLSSPYKIGIVSNYNSIFNNIIHAPGPTLKDTFEGRDTSIRLVVGRFITIPSVVITSVQIDVPNRFTPQGYPIEANVNVGLRTQYILLREDYQQLFGGR